MLETVKVPEAFEPLFAKAEAHVREFFAQQTSDPSKGKIEIQGSRYVLLRGAAFSVEFFQIIRKLFGKDHIQDADLFSASLLYELAHAVGRSDAKNFHQTMSLTDPISKLSAGPVHFSHTGWAMVEIDEESNPAPDESFFLVYRHPYSFECDAWLESECEANHPVCVMNAGYSSGWCQESFGIPLEAREITCRSTGGEDCLFIMAQPHVIESKIETFKQRHQHIDVFDTKLSFKHQHLKTEEGGRSPEIGAAPEEKQKVTDHRDAFGSQSIRDNLKHRLLAYARNLEVTQTQLAEKVEALNKEIEERRRVEQALIQSESRWRELSEATFDAIVLCREEAVIEANSACEQLFGKPVEAMMEKKLSTLFSEDSYAIVSEAIQRRDSTVDEVQLLQGGQEKFVDIHIHFPQAPGQALVILAIRDITERAVAIKRLERLANFDALTGLPNRSHFQRVVNRTLMASNFSHKHAMLFLDLDDFKKVNDRYGHSAGDHLLFAVADRISRAIRSVDTVCRLGGDEFAVWLPDIHYEEDAGEVAQHIMKAMEAPIEINREQIAISFSIGIALYPHDGTDYANLTKNSDIAMYGAKKAGRNQSCFYAHVKSG